jgi:hypothetical protein
LQPKKSYSSFGADLSAIRGIDKLLEIKIMATYNNTTEPYTLASFINNLDIFLASLPVDFQHGNKKHIAELPHPEAVKTQYRFWLENIQPKCIRVVVRDLSTPDFVCLRESNSTVNPIVCHITKDFVDFHSGRYFDDEESANRFLDNIERLSKSGAKFARKID